MYAIHLTTRPDAVAVLTIDQPGSRANVLTAELWKELESTIDALKSRTDLRGLVLASAKPDIFIAGADLKLLANATGPNDPLVRDFIQLGLRVLEKLESLPFPTCAAINGAALGGGLEVALACDSRVCGTNPKVRLGLPEVTLGLIPGWGGTQRLPRIACSLRTSTRQLAKAAEFLASGRSLGCEEAASLDFGLLHSVIGSDGLLEFAVHWLLLPMNPRREEINKARREVRQGPIPADQLAAFAPPSGLSGAAIEAVRVMIEGAMLPLYEGIQFETAAFLRLAGSEQSRRLIGEFFASRKK